MSLPPLPLLRLLFATAHCSGVQVTPYSDETGPRRDQAFDTAAVCYGKDMRGVDSRGGEMGANETHPCVVCDFGGCVDACLFG